MKTLRFEKKDFTFSLHLAASDMQINVTSYFACTLVLFYSIYKQASTAKPIEFLNVAFPSANLINKISISSIKTAIIVQL